MYNRWSLVAFGPPYRKNLNHRNYYKWIDEKLNKKSLEYCGEINFFEHTGPKILLLNKEYISLDEKLDFAKNHFDYVLSSNVNLKNIKIK